MHKWKMVASLLMILVDTVIPLTTMVRAPRQWTYARATHSRPRLSQGASRWLRAGHQCAALCMLEGGLDDTGEVCMRTLFNPPTPHSRPPHLVAYTFAANERRGALRT